MREKEKSQRRDYWRNAIIIDKLSSCDKEIDKIEIQVKLIQGRLKIHILTLFIFNHVNVKYFSSIPHIFGIIKNYTRFK